MSRISNKRLNDALSKQEAAIRRAFLEAIERHKGSINISALVEALEAGDIERAVRLASIPNLFTLGDAIVSSYTTGAQTIVEAAPRFAVSFGFDGRHARAEKWVRENVGELVEEGITNAQRQILRETIERQIREGTNPRRVAIEIAGRTNPLTRRRQGGIIGLNDFQVKTLRKVRLDLANLDERYFTRKLRDRRFDGIVKRAIAANRALSQTDIDRISNRYADRALKHRAEVIARTESLNALRAGRDEGVRQAIEQGGISNAEKMWDATGDSRTRNDHLQMEGQRVALDKPFVAPDGSELMYPGDTSLNASADQIVQCRCIVDYRVDWVRSGRRQRGVSPSHVATPPPRDVIAAGSASRLRQRGAQTGHEHFEIINANGDIVAASSSGHAHKIELTDEHRRLLARRGADLSFHHNHPAPVTSFSPADINSFSKLAGMTNIYAHAEQATFRAGRTTKTSRITSRVLKTAEKDASALLAKALNSGANVSELLRLEAHAMMLILQKRGYVDYEFELPLSAANVARVLNDNL